MRRFRLVAVAAVALLVSAQVGTAAPGFRTKVPPMLTLAPGAPAGSNVKAIISSGDEFGGFEFEGVPDGIGWVDQGSTVDVYVTHEQSRNGIPFLGQNDIEDSSISRLTLSVGGKVLDAEVALPHTEGFVRFCSAFMAGTAEGFASPVFFANEESPDPLPVPASPPASGLYGPDPFYSPANTRQAGYAVYLDVETGDYDVIPGMGRHNHENTVVVPGGWDEVVALSGDDTFDAPASQLYMYVAETPEALLDDDGGLWAFRVTATGHSPSDEVDEEDAFNGANDYGDIAIGEDWEGEFISVPAGIAAGTDPTEGGTLPPLNPQQALERWSNNNNVFQFIRVEDIAYDKNDPNVVYFADTGERRARPDATTGRLFRGSSTCPCPYPNGRIFQMELNPANPLDVTSFSILRDDDAAGFNNPSPGVMHQPDNIDTSANSLMVQEDSAQAPFSRIWRYDFTTETWSVVASVNDLDWESSGIVNAFSAFGPGAWLVTIQAHDTFVDTDATSVPGVLLKREAGQLLLVRLPGT